EYGIAVLPSNLRLSRGKLRAVPLVHRGASIGNWAMIAWDPQRLLAPYAEQFITELAASLKRTYPGRNLIRRAPTLPRPREPDGGGCALTRTSPGTGHLNRDCGRARSYGSCHTAVAPRPYQCCFA